jgi:hypothetical protein
MNSWQMPGCLNVTRREFLRRYGIASSALTLSPFFLERFAALSGAIAPLTRVYLVKNGDCFQNIAKLWELMGGVGKYISATDIVVIKANGQWPNQGYSHTGCIKAVIDAILQIPGFSGEILICDNIQVYGVAGAVGFDATPANRAHNWPDHNWDSLAAAYQAQGKPVATKRWINSSAWTAPQAVPALSAWSPSDGEGWHRYFFNYGTSGKPTYISCPVFESPLTPGRMIDLKNGVWENGSHTSRRVRTICLPTLNNHGAGAGEDCGITSAIKSFYGATEIHGGVNGKLDVYSNMHSAGSVDSTSGHVSAPAVGELVATYLQQCFAPVLYITAAMWSGWYSRTGEAAETKTVLACENPVTLDYVSARDVISPYASWLNPDEKTHTQQQIVACNARGIGVISPRQFEVITYDFNHPTAHRLDVERKIRDLKANRATEQEVKDTIKLYMEGD